MTILDIAVVIIVVCSSIRGVIKGFFLSVFDIVSFFIAAFLTGKLYHVFSDFLLKTKIYEWIEKSVYGIILKTNPFVIETSGSSIKDETVKNVIDSFSLPLSMKALLIKQEQNQSIGFLNIDNILQHLSGGIAKLIINVLSMIILFCIIKLILTVVAGLINQFMKLPILHQVNKLAGGAFGMVSGVVIIYIICAVFILIAPVQVFNPLADLINKSLIIKEFYNNNILLNWIL